MKRVRGKSDGKREIPRSVRRPETRLASRLATPPPPNSISLPVFYTRRSLGETLETLQQHHLHTPLPPHHRPDGVR